jgi:hypothetical protein
MQRARTAAAIALLLFVCSSAPSFAIERQRGGPGEDGPIDRIVRLIRHIVNPIVRAWDDLSVPKP